MGRTHVTVGQWKQLVTATRYVTDGEKKGEANTTPGPGQKWRPIKGANWQDPKFGLKLKDNHPVSCISWNDAVVFCEWLDQREQRAGRLPSGYKVRLPTEAEWEYACRAGQQTKFWWGESEDGSENRLNCFGPADGFEFLSPADYYGARGRNKFGLADMLGNMREWCLDGFDQSGAHEDIYKGNTSERVIRSGSFTAYLSFNRCAFRNGRLNSYSDSCNGFRVAVGPAR